MISIAGIGFGAGRALEATADLYDLTSAFQMKKIREMISDSKHVFLKVFIFYYHLLLSFIIIIIIVCYFMLIFIFYVI